MTLTALRLATASIVLCGVLCFLKPKYRWSSQGAVDLVIIGLLNVGLPFLTLAKAVEYISSSLAAMLFNAQPVLTIVAAHCLLPDEKLNASKIIGALTAVAGATILLASNASGLEAGHDQGWIGQLLIIIGSLSGALGVIYTRIRLREQPAFVLAAGQAFASLLIMAPLALAIEGLPAFTAYPWQGWAAMLVAALSSPVMAFGLLFYMINRYSASLAGFSGIAAPLFSFIIGVAFLGEVVTVPIGMGACLLLAGVWSLYRF
jgi:drug/metabolite transporter (DMT)-like permease